MMARNGGNTLNLPGRNIKGNRLKWGHSVLVLALSVLLAPNPEKVQSATTPECNALYASTFPKGTRSGNLEKKEVRLAEYRKRAILDDTAKGGLGPEWMRAYEAILSTDRAAFRKRIPRSRFPKVDGKAALHYNTPDQIRFEDLTRTDKISTYAPHFYHMTSAKYADSIAKDGLRLSRGAHNEAAICLGDASFPHYQRKFRSEDEVTLFEVRLKPETKILDLTQHKFGERGPQRFSYYGAYEWYTDVFVEDLKKGVYQSQFPELTQFAQSQKGISALESKEAFAHLMDADAIMTSEQYGPISVDEYWVINPWLIQSVEFAKGTPPGTKTLPIDKP